jgi:hypothetical protein
VDDYGNTITTESAVAVYVKPHTPKAPTVSAPTASTVDVVVNAHDSAASGLDYAIYVTPAVSGGNWVQADGSVGAGEVWWTIAEWSTKTVTGLSSPVSQYSFQVKSRNSVDDATESDLSNAGSTANSAPVAGYAADNVIPFSQVSQSTDGNGIITITFRVQDAQSDLVTLEGFSYSDDGGAGWYAPINGDGSGSLGGGWPDNGGAKFTSAADWSGTEHRFTFNTRHVDVENSHSLDAIEIGDFQVRFRVNDATASSVFYAVSQDVVLDNEEPSANIVYPVDDTTGVGVNANLVIIFSEPVDAISGNIIIRHSSDNSLFETIAVTDNAKVSGSGTDTIIVDPDGTFTSEAGYFIQIDSTAFDDLSGNSYAGISDVTTWSFTAADVIEPTVPSLSLSPIDDASDVGVNDSLVIVFEEPVNVVSGNITIRRSSDSAVFEIIAVTDNSKVSGSGTNTITINPDSTFSGQEEYFVQVDSTAFDDLSGNSFAGISDAETWNFSTEDIVDPVTASLLPADDAVGVSVNDNLVIVFDEPVNIVSGYVIIKHASDSSVFEAINVTSANVSGSGTDTITVNPSGTFSSETEYFVQIDATAFDDLSGNSYAGITDDAGWRFTTIDLDGPVVVSLIPETEEANAGVRGDLTIIFSEETHADSGYIIIKRLSDNKVLDSIDVTSPQVTGSGTDTIVINPDTVLGELTAYFIQIDSTAFVDSLGNRFAGISGEETWHFRTEKIKYPEVDSITSEKPGTYGEGDTVTFTIHFSEAVTLSGGNLEITLETGGTDQVVSIPPFDTLETLEVEYVIQRGDSTDSLEVKELGLAEDVSLQNTRGDTLMLAIAPDRNLPNFAVITLDGVPPQIFSLKPVSNNVMLYPTVSYELPETLKSGSIVWRNGYKDGVFLADTIRTEKTLDSSDLAVGTHKIRLDDETLVRGASYEVVINLEDSVGNTREIVIDLVKIVSEVSAIKVSPADTTAEMGDFIQFTAVGIEVSAGHTSEYELDSVSWSTPGLGVIDDEGYFMVSSLGENLVIASINDTVSDTARATVDSTSVDIPSDGDKTVSIGRDVELVLPPLSGLTQTLMEAFYLESSMRPEELILVGPALMFGEHADGPWEFAENVTMRLRIDPTKVDNEDLDRVQVYMRGATDSDPWILVPSIRDRYWLEIETDALGAYMVALDTVPPSISWMSDINKGDEGEEIEVSYTASDNIANPQVRLRVHVGGSMQDSLIDLDYERGAVSYGTIPRGLVTPFGLWYTVEIWDGANLVVLDTMDVRVTLTGDLGMLGTHG